VNFGHVPKFEILDVTRLPPPPNRNLILKIRMGRKRNLEIFVEILGRGSGQVFGIDEECVGRHGQGALNWVDT
jgi:hypothetical protein